MPRLENSLADAETLSVDRTKPFWWRRLTDTDPISLEKLSRLRVEPFELLADGKHTYWFDGKILANYLVSTGNFLHPISRRELTRDDCARLDAHLRQNRLGRACVEHAFNHQEDYKKAASPENHVLQLQREASALLRAFYETQPEREPGRTGRGGRDQRENAPAGAPVSAEAFEETVPLSGADVTSAADFPSLAGPAGAAAPALSSAVWTSQHARPASLASASMEDDFPSLGGQRAPRPAATGGGWAGRARPLPAEPAAPPQAVLAPGAPPQPPPNLGLESFPGLGGGASTRPQARPAAGTWTRAVADGPTAYPLAPDAPAPAPEFRVMTAEFPSLAGAPVSNVATDRDELVRRNRALLGRLTSELGADHADGMRTFRTMSAAFQKGQLDSRTFLDKFDALFGERATLALFPELVSLMPVPEKRAELTRCFDDFRERISSRPPPPAPGGWAGRVGSG